jgi:hypothetical protein
MIWQFYSQEYILDRKLYAYIQVCSEIFIAAPTPNKNKSSCPSLLDVNLYKGIWYSNEKGQVTAMCSNVDESHIYNVKENEHERL